MGKVMGAVKTRLAGKADMGQVSAAVKRHYKRVRSMQLPKKMY